ncbi:IS110 family RNA-guided transposase, partial [Facilibium subflavum]|uniref:IS110 family transposase n=1 Tax=Facilibium subflavum TaxID=2219058 RepID=UPI000E6540ED
GANVETVYEAGFSGFHLHRELIQVGINNQVVHPGSIEVATRDRVKTDKRDAKKMATQLAAGRLKGIYVPTLEQEAKRSASRLRNNIVKLRHQIGQKLKSLLFTQGLISGEDDTVLSERWLNKKLEGVRKLDYPSGFYYTVKRYADQWILFTQDLAQIRKDLLDMQTEEEHALMMIYQSAPGIGEIVALRLKDELADMKQFSNEKKLFNYLGFTPVEYSSGEHVRQGHISRQGRAALRHIFVEAAWIAIRKDPQLNEVYQRLAKTRGGKRAIVGVARRLAGRLRSCIQQGILYEIKPLKTETTDTKMSYA